MMKGAQQLAVQCVKYSANAAEAVSLQYIPRREPKTLRKGQVLLDVLASGCDFVQTLLVGGKYQVKLPLPFTVGGEVTGRVVATGEGVQRLKAGDLVHGAHFGAWTERVVVPARTLLLLPPDIDPVRVPSAYSYLSSLHALKDRAGLQAGETLLVLGASGGVGSTAIELGKQMGAKVIACASSAAKLDACRELGADHLVNYETEDLKKRVRALTDGHGADVVFDPVGDRFCEPAIRALAWRGRYIVVGFAAGAIPRVPTNLLLLKEAMLIGSAMREFGVREPRGALAERNELEALIAGNKLSPLVTSVRRLRDASEVLEQFQNRQVQGKVVLVTPLYESEFGITSCL